MFNIHSMIEPIKYSPKLFWLKSFNLILLLYFLLAIISVVNCLSTYYEMQYAHDTIPSQKTASEDEAISVNWANSILMKIHGYFFIWSYKEADSSTNV